MAYIPDRPGGEVLTRVVVAVEGAEGFFDAEPHEQGDEEVAAGGGAKRAREVEGVEGV